MEEAKWKGQVVATWGDSGDSKCSIIAQGKLEPTFKSEDYAIAYAKSIARL